MASSTLTLNSTTTRATGQYKRTLPYTKPLPSRANPNLYIQPPEAPAALTQSGDVGAMWIQDSLMVAGAAFQSDNTNSGITFIVLQRKEDTADYTDFYLNVADNSSGQTDYGDSIYLDTGSKYLPSLNGATIIAGSENSIQPIAGAKDVDLVFFGSETSKNGNVYNFTTKYDDSIRALSLAGVVEPSSSKALTIDGTSVYTGKDDDTLVFANTNAASVIANSTFDLGTGADLVYFAAPSTIFGGNMINVGGPGGVADGQVDSIIFNFYTGSGSPLSNLDGTGSNFINIKGFGDDDQLFYSGEVYTGKQAVTDASWNTTGIIKFDV